MSNAKYNHLPRPADLFWMGVFPFTTFMINHIIFTIALDWARSVYADDYLHFLGGASIAFSVCYLLNILSKSEELIIKNNLIKFIIILAGVALAAVMWELYEFISDILYTPVRQPTTADTMKDLVVGLLGGAVLASSKILLETKNQLK